VGTSGRVLHGVRGEAGFFIRPKASSFQDHLCLFLGVGEQDLAGDLEKLSKSDVNELAATVKSIVKTDSKR
jgi:hypothetical protein